jgi:site-specific recombinase XerD
LDTEGKDVNTHLILTLLAMSQLTVLNIKFFVKKNRAKNNLAPLYVRIAYGTSSVDLSLKRDIDLANWDGPNGRPIGSRDDVRAINNQLDQVRAEITNCYTELKYQKKDITAEVVRDLFCGIVPKERTLGELIEYHNGHLKHTLAWGTMKNYITTQAYIRRFIEKNYQGSDLPLSRLSYTFLVDFEIFLLNYKPLDHHKPCTHNTVLKHIERLRKMINVAIKNEWIEKDPFAKFQAKFIRKDRQILNEEEVEALEQKDIKVDRLAWARDLFVFSVYTGLAYCDVMTLTSQNVTRGIDGEYWIITARQKTHQSVRVPLLPKAMEIVTKYRTDPRALAAGTLFPTLSNQNLNAYLKEIADICGIEKNLTFHLARHTFATTIALCNGVPIETVSKILGHTSIRTTQIYAKVVEKKVSQDMSSLRSKLLAKSQPIPQFKGLQAAQ